MNTTPAFFAWLSVVETALDGPVADFTDADAVDAAFTAGVRPLAFAGALLRDAAS